MTVSSGRWRAAPVILAAALLAALTAGCASSRGLLVKREVVLPFDDAQRKALAEATAMPYRLQRGDLMSVFFLHNEAYKQLEVLVLPDGSANFVGLDRVPVAGMTVGHLDSLLTDRYAQIVRDPDLSVVVVKTVGRQVYVLGEVRSPGIYSLPTDGTGLLAAITLAGGYTDVGARGSVVLLRVTPEGYVCREFDLSGLRGGGGLDAAFFDLRPYDVVYVPRTKIGDFAVFTKDFVVSVLSYTRLFFDMKAVSNPQYLVR